VLALARAHARGIAGAKMGRRESCHRLLPAAPAAPMYAMTNPVSHQIGLRLRLPDTDAP